MHILFENGTRVEAGEFFDSIVEQWAENTPESEQTFESFAKYVEFSGFHFGPEWIQDRWLEYLDSVK